MDKWVGKTMTIKDCGAYICHMVEDEGQRFPDDGCGWDWAYMILDHAPEQKPVSDPEVNLMEIF